MIITESGITIGSNCILRSKFSRMTSDCTEFDVTSAKKLKVTRAKRM